MTPEPEEREPAAQSPAAAAATPPSAEPRLLGIARSVLPWASLAFGVAGAFTMDRGPKRGALVAAAAVGLWIALIALQWFVRAGRERSGRAALLLRAASWSSLLAAQSLVQLAFFFALPFYLQAATLDPGHGVFLLGLCGLSAASLWDPFTEHVLMRPALAPLLPALASFAALAAVLPGLGLSTRTSLWAAAVIAAIGAATTAIASVPPGQRARVAGVVVPVVLLIPVALWLGAARIVPAAPLRLMKIEIGTQRAGHWIADPTETFDHVPERLFCATAIYSPVGVKDRLFHVWSRGGERRARVELDIRGGRGAGYRTFSRIGPLGRNAAGVYSCRVETQTGQVLGSRSVRIR